MKSVCFSQKTAGVSLIVPIAKNRFRGVSDRPDAKTKMPSTLKIDTIHREGDFVIWVKQAESYSRGRVYIAGDAAHSHSPVGGRGMNLGIADAHAFARLFAEKRLDRYSNERHSIGTETIRLTEFGRRFVTSEFPGKLLFFRKILPFIVNPRFLQKRIAKIALDS